MASVVRRLLGQISPPVELISLHVPKAAGTSFRSVLRAVYGEHAVWADYGQYVEDPHVLFRKDPELAGRLALDGVSNRAPQHRPLAWL